MTVLGELLTGKAGDDI